MRKIKFRGRRSYDKEWIYGSLLIDNSGDFYILESDVVEKDGHHIHIDSDSPMFFDNDTVGQFTGLHDKNGVEIYEGDILKYEWDGKTKIDYIVFSGGMFTYSKCVRWSLHEDEVIGNIYENSDLFGGRT